MLRPASKILAFNVALIVAAAAAMTAFGSSTPVGKLPPGPVITMRANVGQLVAVALPKPPGLYRGYSWRLARTYDSGIVREVAEADVASGVVVVYRTVGRGNTSVVYALTRGDSSSVAVRSVTHRLQAR